MLMTLRRVFAKPFRLDFGAKVSVGRRDDPYVDLDRIDRAERKDLLVFDQTQQLDLHRGRELADLVEEDRSSACTVEESLVGRVSAGESALGMTEELALEKRVGYGGAIDRQKDLVA